MDTVEITFTQTRVVQDEHTGTARETRFEAGKSYKMPKASADRWTKRGVAVEGKLAAAKASPPAEPKPVTIPDKWKDLPADDRKKLAKEITGKDAADAKAADAAIEAELANRAAG